MKRLVMIATMFVFVLGLAATASAADLTATGSWKMNVAWIDNLDFTDATESTDSEDDMILQQRVRTTFTFTANENLKGVLGIEIGTSEWGEPGGGADLGADDRVIEVKSAYINFVWPNSSVGVYAGVMNIGLPGYSGSPVFDDDVAGAIVAVPVTDNIQVLGAYMRLYSDELGNTGFGAQDDEADVDNFLDGAAVIVPMTFDGFNVTPYAAFVWSGNEFLTDAAGAATTAAGAATNWDAAFPGLMSQNMTAGQTDGGTGVNITYFGVDFGVQLLDPLTINGSFHYGAMHGPWTRTDREGWLGELALGWNQPLLGDYGLYPELYFAYSSGEDGNGSKGDGASERLPQVSQAYAPGSFFFGGEFLDNADIDSSYSMGFWTLGLFLKDISFVDGLTHDINVMYIAGTNDKDIGTVRNNLGSPYGLGVAYGQTLTEEDSLWEFDLNTSYSIYEELTAVVNLGYMKQNFDDDVWTEAQNGDDEDAGKIVIGLEYAF